MCEHINMLRFFPFTLFRVRMTVRKGFRMTEGLWVFVILLSFNVFSSTFAFGSRWSETGINNKERAGHSCVLLTNGKVMAIGGHYSDSDYEIFNPATGTWALYPMSFWIDHTMGMLLPNGKVICIGSNAYLYNSHLNTWTPSLATTLSWRYRACATLLKDGTMLCITHSRNPGRKCNLYNRTTDLITQIDSASAEYEEGVEILLPTGEVLIAGGSVGTKCELYDPVAKSWRLTTTPLQKGRNGHVGVLLPPPWENKILVAGGKTNTCELYNIGSSSWSYTDSLDVPQRYLPSLSLLPSGKVLIAGGCEKVGVNVTMYRSCELYDPDIETWSSTDSMISKRFHHPSVILPTGKVLTMGSFLLSSVKSELYDPSDGVWETKPSLVNERAAHTTTPLPIIPTSNCSTNVLIAGGENSSGALASCELYNYSLDNVSVTDDLNEKRTYHTATLLPSGEVLVTGGKNASGEIKSCELYDVSTESWAITDSLDNVRYDHAATLLKDGSVLTTGGQLDAVTYIGGCEIYSGGVWTNIVDCFARARHTAVLLLDGRVLVIGGENTFGVLNTCEIWDGVTWTATGDLIAGRYLHTATLLQSGKVLVAGGTNNGTSGLSSCEIFDPDSNKWFPEGNLNQARYLHNTTLLYSGLVLVTGGNGGSNSCETYDPATHKWTTDYTGTLITGRAYHSSVLVPDTMPFILAIGGKDGAGGYLTSIEEYDVGLGYRKIWQSTITNYPAVTPISNPMDIEGTLFRGVSEADGGNHCHTVSNDHPIISLVRIGGGNWQGNGGGEILHMPLSFSWDEIHTDVHPEIADFQGYYRLWSIVNGIPCKWYPPCPAGTEEKTGERHKATGISVSVYPNPAIRESHIVFSISHNDSRFTTHDLRLTIYDISGRLVRSLTIRDSRFTIDEVIWDGKDLEGKKVKSGIYFYRIEHKDFEERGKFIILK